MSKPTKPIAFGVIILVATALAAYVLNLLDQIVHSQLYNYGLEFSLAWANPYWNLLRIIQILLGIIAISTAVNVILTVRKYVFTKKPSVKIAPSPKPTITAPSRTHTISSPARRVPSTVHTVERALSTPATQSATPVPVPRVFSPPSTPPAPSASEPTPRPTPSPFSSEVAGLIRCANCGKAFTQPLRMLDFQGDRPRILSICPFCNEIITTAPR